MIVDRPAAVHDTQLGEAFARRRQRCFVQARDGAELLQIRDAVELREHERIDRGERELRQVDARYPGRYPAPRIPSPPPHAVTVS